MKTRSNIRVTRSLTVGLVAAVGASALLSGAARTESWIMATDRAGTLYNASGAGIAKVLTKHSKYRTIVRAFGGPDAFIHDVNRGKYLLTAQSSNTAWFNFHGRTRSK